MTFTTQTDTRGATGGAIERSVILYLFQSDGHGFVEQLDTHIKTDTHII